MINTKSHLGRTRLISSYNALVTGLHWETSEQELNAGSWNQELKQRPRRNAAYRLAPQGWWASQDRSSWDAAHSELCPSALISNKNKCPQTRLQARLIKGVPQLRLLQIPLNGVLQVFSCCCKWNFFSKAREYAIIYVHHMSLPGKYFRIGILVTVA